MSCDDHGLLESADFLMSEYQYYEFQALDRPLDGNELQELRSLSTRATITPTSFINEYNYGDFKGDPRVLIEKYFDAFVYFANWGTRWVMFRLPGGAVDTKRLAAYFPGNSASIWTKGKHVILDFVSNAESDEWEEESNWLATLIPLRNDILDGDLRALYLSWLWCVQDDQIAGKSIEPPVPPGLGNLLASLQSFADFLRIDEDLIAAAAQQSDEEEVSGPASDKELLRSIRSLEEVRKDDLLLQVMEGKGLEVKAALQQAFRPRWPSTSDKLSVRRSAEELLSIAETISAERHGVAAALAAKEQRRREREQETARAMHLEKLSKMQAATWRKVETLIETKQPLKYDEAVDILRDLQELSTKQGKQKLFAFRMEELRLRHARKSSLLARFDRKLSGNHN